VMCIVVLLLYQELSSVHGDDSFTNLLSLSYLTSLSNDRVSYS